MQPENPVGTDLLQKHYNHTNAAQYIPVYAKLTDGTGNVSKTAYLHFELQNSHLEALMQE
jgi:hypothetical protein